MVHVPSEAIWAYLAGKQRVHQIRKPVSQLQTARIRSLREAVISAMLHFWRTARPTEDAGSKIGCFPERYRPQ